MVRLFCLITCMFYAIAAFAHNVYSSFTRIDWNTADSSIELVIELQAHELEAKLSVILGERLSFLEDSDYTALEAATADYIPENIELTVDGETVSLVYLGMEIDKQLVRIYLEKDLTKAPETLSFMNAILLQDLPGQTNIVLANIKGVKRGADITASSGPADFIFN
ncbi:MAG: hypothetical protein JKY34_05530 [Kordiimonadaceae bacterium]|nr:hypothetical protein [Kordiimonadaceae bacterium]